MMELTGEEQSMLAGERGRSVQTAMRILDALGRIYGAERMIPVRSAQIAGVSYDNLGDAGLAWLSEMADGGGRVCVPTTLNPAGMDLENWRALGIPEDFAAKQIQVVDSFTRMGATRTCTCTPYLAGYEPSFGESIAWAESSAVCYANSVIGARTNREGGPSALASALTGRTAEYGMHLTANRRPGVTVEVRSTPSGTADFGALGKAIGERVEGLGGKPLPWIAGIPSASVEELKSFCASLATYGGLAMFHMQGITPEAGRYPPPAEQIVVTEADLQEARRSLCDDAGETDFVSLGCPHLTLEEVERIADLLGGKRVTKEFWITTSRAVKQAADRRGFTATIEASGAKFAVDTCCVVAPIRGRFRILATDSAKACYYARAKNHFKTRLMDFDRAVEAAQAAPMNSNSGSSKTR
jgi:predicted aconitase